MKQILILVLSLTIYGFSEENYLFAGKHFLASYEECDPGAIENFQGMLHAMDDAVQASGATILSQSHYLFPPSGVTVVYLLSESHASLHTYPEHKSCFVDLFTCGDHCSAEKFDQALRSYLQPKKVSAKFFIRTGETEETPYTIPNK